MPSAGVSTMSPSATDGSNATPTGTVAPSSSNSPEAVTFGSERFSPGNLLKQRIFEVSDNLTIPMGAHTFTAGARFERSYTYNYFLSGAANGAYSFANIADLAAGRPSGFLFSYDGAAAEELLGITAGIDLMVRYRANGQRRMRTFLDVVFLGDATVTFPSQNNGVSELIGVPFRVQIPEGQTLGQHILDEED